jgi:hypothetical protein
MLSTPTTMLGRCLHWLTSRPRLPARHWLQATDPKKVRAWTASGNFPPMPGVIGFLKP